MLRNNIYIGFSIFDNERDVSDRCLFPICIAPNFAVIDHTNSEIPLSGREWQEMVEMGKI